MSAQHMPRDTSHPQLRAALVISPPSGAIARASERVAAGAKEAAETSRLRASHEFDWRFMLPDPHLGPVWLASECKGGDMAPRTTSVEVVTQPESETRVAFVDGSQCDFGVIERALPPGALVRIAVVGAGVLGRLRPERGWRVVEELEDRGWQVLGRIWATGGIAAAAAYLDSAYLDLDDRRTVMYWWKTRAGGGVRAKVAVAIRLTLARLGLWRLLCDEGFVFARTPA